MAKIIFIIGYGNMGQAIARALVKSKVLSRIYISDKKPIKQVRGVVLDRTFKNLTSADFIIVAVKPQDIGPLAGEVKAKLNPSAVIISIAAGVPIAKIQKLFRHKKVVRIMPNLGLLVGQGIAAWKSAGFLAKEKLAVKKLLNQITENFEVKNENQIDAVTAISGSGPAYFFYLAQSLYEAAKSFGFDEKIARVLVEKTFSGAALLQIGKDYKDLIIQVRSKKGTTDAALKVFQKRRLSEIIKLAVKAAYSRAKELDNG